MQQVLTTKKSNQSLDEEKYKLSLITVILFGMIHCQMQHYFIIFKNLPTSPIYSSTHLNYYYTHIHVNAHICILHTYTPATRMLIYTPTSTLNITCIYDTLRRLYIYRDILSSTYIYITSPEYLHLSAYKVTLDQSCVWQKNAFIIKWPQFLPLFTHN